MENKPLSSPSLLQTTAALFGEGEKIPSENPCGEARGRGEGWVVVLCSKRSHYSEKPMHRNQRVAPTPYS